MAWTRDWKNVKSPFCNNTQSSFVRLVWTKKEPSYVLIIVFSIWFTQVVKDVRKCGCCPENVNKLRAFLLCRGKRDRRCSKSFITRFKLLCSKDVKSEVGSIFFFFWSVLSRKFKWMLDGYSCEVISMFPFLLIIIIYSRFLLPLFSFSW